MYKKERKDIDIFISEDENTVIAEGIEYELVDVNLEQDEKDFCACLGCHFNQKLNHTWTECCYPYKRNVCMDRKDKQEKIYKIKK